MLIQINVDRQDGEGSGIQNDFTEAMEHDLEEFMNGMIRYCNNRS